MMLSFYLWTLVIIGRPQDILPGLLFGLHPGKIAALLTLLLYFLDVKKKVNENIFQTPEVLVFLFFCLLMAASGLCGVYPGQSWEFLKDDFFKLVIYLLVLSRILITPKDIRKLAWVIVWSAVIISLGSLSVRAAQADRVSVGTMYDPNDLAMVLVISFPFVLYFFLEGNGFRKVILAGAGAVILSAFLLTRSRGGFLGLMTIILTFAFEKQGISDEKQVISDQLSVVSKDSGWNPASGNQQPATSIQQPVSSNQQPATSIQQPATSIPHSASSIQRPANFSHTWSKKAVVLILIFALIGLASNQYWQRIQTILSGEDRGSMRDVIWGRGLKIFAQNPWLGVGVGCFPTAYGRALEQGRFAKVGNVYDRSWREAHNSFLQVGTEMGIAGLLVFLFLIGLSIKNFRETKNLALAACNREESSYPPFIKGDPLIKDGKGGTNSDIHRLAEMFSLGLIGFLVCGFFLSQAYSIFPYLFLAVSGILRRQFNKYTAR
jgi:O-antigen ligase